MPVKVIQDIKSIEFLHDGSASRHVFTFEKYDGGSHKWQIDAKFGGWVFTDKQLKELAEAILEAVDGC